MQHVVGTCIGASSLEPSPYNAGVTSPASYFRNAVSTSETTAGLRCMTRDSHRLWLRGTWVLVDRRGPHLRHPEKPSSGGRIDPPANKGGRADNALVCRCLSVPFKSELKEPPPLRQRLSRTLHGFWKAALLGCSNSAPAPCADHWDASRRSCWRVVRSFLLRTRGTF